MKKTFERGDLVVVTDPDGTKWRGRVDCPSVLWDDWYAVRKHGRGGKTANQHVHGNEMAKEKPNGK